MDVIIGLFIDVVTWVWSSLRNSDLKGDPQAARPARPPHVIPIDEQSARTGRILIKAYGLLVFGVSVVILEAAFSGGNNRTGLFILFGLTVLLNPLFWNAGYRLLGKPAPFGFPGERLGESRGGSRDR